MRVDVGAGMRAGLLLQLCSVLWLAVEALVAISARIAARSFLLMALGAESDIELVSAALLLWSLSLEAPGRSTRHREQVETLGARFVGIAMFLLATSVLLAAFSGLLSHAQPAASPLGIAVAGASLLMMRLLALAKHRIGERTGDEAQEGDATILRDRAFLATVVLAGLLFTAVAGWWWAEEVAALLFLLGLLEEARDTVAEARGTGGGVQSAA